jgi:hypothetical protein
VAEYSLSSLHAKEIKFVLQRVPRGSAFYSRREVFMIKLYQFKPALGLPNAVIEDGGKLISDRLHH